MSFKTIDEGLNELTEKVKDGKSLSFEEVLETLSGKGRPLLLVFLSLPFCQPIQIPGFSTLFGIVVALIGLRMGFGKKLWLPKWIKDKHISAKTINKISRLTLKTSKKLKFLIHPRLNWICHSEVMHKINGIGIIILGLFLALPLPIPLSNIVAAWGLILIGLGLLGDDGLFVLLGHVFVLVTIGFFVSIVFFTEKLVVGWL